MHQTLSRESVLTSRVHAVSWIHNKDFVLPPRAMRFVGGRTLFNLFHGWLLKTRSWEAGALERPSVTSARPRQPMSAGKPAGLPRSPRARPRGFEVSLPDLGNSVGVSPQAKQSVGCLARPSAAGNTKRGAGTKTPDGTAGAGSARTASQVRLTFRCIAVTYTSAQAPSSQPGTGAGLPVGQAFR